MLLKVPRALCQPGRVVIQYKHESHWQTAPLLLSSSSSHHHQNCEKCKKNIEKSNRIGGRIYTYSNKGYKYDVGAGRLGKKQKLIMKLIKELELEDKIYDITTDKNYFVDNKLLNEKELLKYFNSKFISDDVFLRMLLHKYIQANLHAKS